MPRRLLLAVLLLAMTPVLSAQDAETVPGRLANCPDSPNCVSSDAPDPSHHVPAFALILPPREAWRLARQAVAAIPRTKIIDVSDGYLHAECRSLVFRFVDDLELELRPGEGIIAVRSASRTGTSDLGVNRRRVEGLRSVLQSRGAIK